MASFLSKQMWTPMIADSWQKKSTATAFRRSHALRLLRLRRERPRRRRAAQCEHEFSPSDVNCHATPPAGGCVHATEGTISRFSEGMNNAFALRKS
jgi:hypothetical protein